MDPTALYSLDRDGARHGPYTRAQLQQYLREGSVVATDMVWTAGMPTWIPVGHLLGAAAPPPPNVVPPIIPGAASAHASGLGLLNTPESTAPGPLQSYRRPAAITLLAVLHFLGAAFWVVALVGLLLFAPDGTSALIGLVWVALAAAQIACGIGLWRLKPYGRTMQQVFAWIGLLGFPIGTIIAIVILVYLRKPGIQIIFSGVPASQLAPSQVAQVEEVSKGGAGGGVLAVVGVVVLIMVMSVVAAIAVPGLLRARMSGNEAAAISLIRTVNSSQVAYQSLCGGYALSLGALGAGNVLPADLAAGVTGATMMRSGYRVTIVPFGPVTAPGPSVPACSETVTSYRALAEPETPGSTGVRYFAVGPDGVVYQDMIPMSDGRLSPTATPISR